jgi:hypothetical protein
LDVDRDMGGELDGLLLLRSLSIDRFSGDGERCMEEGVYAAVGGSGEVWRVCHDR